VKKRKEIKILFMSDYLALCTGFATVGRNILPRLQKLGYQIEHLAWCHQRNLENNFNGIAKQFTTYPAETIEYPTLKFGRGTLANILVETKPDILFTLGDVFMVDYIPTILNKIARNCPIFLSYFPIDGQPVPKKWIPTIEQMDIPVVYSKFAQNELKKASDEKINPLMIYHGVDSQTYKPMDKNEAKKALGLDGKFIIGQISRNQIRKNLDALIKAFAIFCKDKPETMLYLHCAPRKYKQGQKRTELKADVGWDLVDLVERYGLEDRVIFPKNVGPDTGFTEEALNVVINSWDMAVYVSQGEGFGLPVLESLSAGIPTIATDYTSHHELLKGRGELVNCYFQTSIHDNIERAYPVMSDLITKMNLLYHDKELRSKYSRKGREFAEKLTWDSTAKQFDDAIQSYLNDKERVHFCKVVS